MFPGCSQFTTAMNDWNDAERRVEKAQELFEQRRWAEALEELRPATSINPYNGGWFFNIGLTLDEMERFEEAIDAYNRAIEIDANDLQAMQHLGIDHHRVGNFHEALKIFERMQPIDPSFEPSYCHRIMTYGELGEHENAEEMFYLARLYKEHCPHCYYNMGCSLPDRGLFDKAIYCWQKTLDLDEDYPEVQVRIAEAFWGKGELESARQHYLMGLRQDPGNTETLLDLGELLSEMGRDRGSRRKIPPGDRTGSRRPGRLFLPWPMADAAGSDADAAEAFAHVLQLDPTYPAAHLRLGELYPAARTTSSGPASIFVPKCLLRPQDPRCDDGSGLPPGRYRISTARPSPASSGWFRSQPEESARVAKSGRRPIPHRTLRRRHRKQLPGVGTRLREYAPPIYNLALAYERIGEYSEAMHWVRRGLKDSPERQPVRSIAIAQSGCCRIIRRWWGALRKLWPWHS